MRLLQRLWILLTVPVVLCLAVYGVMGARFYRAELLSEAEHEVRETATLLGTVMSALPRDIEAAELHVLAERLTRDSRVLGVGIYDQEGRWLGGSRVASAAHDALHDTVLSVLRRRAYHQETRVVAHRECLVRVEPVVATGDSPAGVVVVLRDLDYIDRALRTWGAQLAAVAAVLVAVMGLVAWRLAGSLTAPVERFLSGVARVTAGDLDATVPEDGEGEVARLGRSFNDLTRSLREAHARLTSEEAARAALEAELGRAQMLAVAGQVAATLGHEIGSPLNVILGRARVTAERDDLAPEVRDTFTSIVTQCERITRVVAQFLSLTRKVPTEAALTADAAHTAREVVNFLGHECRRRKVRAEVVAPSMLRVRCGHDRLFQALFNLCMNALQAQPDGGRLRVRVSRVTDRREGLDDREMACVEVADAGPGVPDAIRGKVFDPFFSTRHQSGGTGLGLAVVAGIVGDLGGKVTVGEGSGDEPDALPGAVFRVLLPLA
jgi:signal transduction histidine kinase